ncbi:MAG: TonB-dependent receptor, partial [Bacteroidales bacterium]
RNLDEVSVIAAGFGEKLKSESGNINLLIYDNYKNESDLNMADIINRIPGVYMQNGNYNTNRLTIRGVGSRNPYGTSRIKAYLNDFPLTGGDGVTVVEDLSMHNISRVEVLKGPASAIYGAGLGGTLRLVTKYPEKRGIRAGTSIYTGSFTSNKFILESSFKGKSIALTGHAGRQQSEGYRENSSYFNNYMLITGNMFFTNFDISLLLSYINLKAHIPSSLTREVFETDPSSADESWSDIKGFEQYDKLLTGFTLLYKISDIISNKLTVFGGYTDLAESRPFNILDNININGGFRNNFNVKFNRIKSNFGIEFYNEIISWKTYQTLTGIRGELVDQIKELRQYFNVFGLFKFNISNKLIADAGINVNFLKFSLKESNNINYPSDIYKYSPVTSPRFGINYALSKKMNIYSSASHGFSSPSFEETLLPEGIINYDLKPEEGWNIDLGVRGNLLKRHLIFDINYYTIFVKNLLVTKRISEEIFTGVNAGNSFYSGMEMSFLISLIANEHLSNELSLTGTATISYNKFVEFIDNGNDYSNNYLPGIPGCKTYVKLSWYNKSGVGMNISYSGTGKQYLNDLNDINYKGYNIIGTNISYTITLLSKVEAVLTFGINNIFNAKYASMILVNAPSFNGSEPRYYYPGMPRNFYFRLQLNI